MPTLKPKNWHEFQHYKDRSPTWVKLHKRLLDDYEFQCLPVDSRALAPMLWLLASESVNGEFDADLSKLAFRLHRTEKEISNGLNPLINAGFIVCDTELLAEPYQISSLETETETYKPETEKRKSKPRAKTAQGTRLPPDVLLESEYVEAAMDTRPEWLYPKISAVFDEFKDYWIAQPGAKGRKTDWLATWRNWCRREKGFVGQSSRRAAVADQIMGGVNGRINTINHVTTTRPVASCREDISAPAVVVWESDNGEMGRD